jgi:hypothetical protein
MRLSIKMLIREATPAARRRRLAERVSRNAFARLLEGTPPPVGEVTATTRGPASQVAGALDKLVERGYAVVEDDRVVGMRGLTVRPTRNTLTMNGHELHTWCAYDLVGITAALAADATINTSCGHCDKPIEVDVRKGEPIGHEAVVGWLPCRTGGRVIDEFCPFAHLFCEEQHLTAWREGMGDIDGEVGDLRQLAEQGRRDWADVARKR